MITGAVAQEEKDRCMKFLINKYGVGNIKAVHIVPIEKRIKVEVMLWGEESPRKHNLKKMSCGNYEEYELPGNDR